MTVPEAVTDETSVVWVTGAVTNVLALWERQEHPRKKGSGEQQSCNRPEPARNFAEECAGAAGDSRRSWYGDR